MLNKIYLTNNKNFLAKNTIIFQETYKKATITNMFTSANIAEYIIKTNHNTAATNNIQKAQEVCPNIQESSNILLIYNNEIPQNIENKILIIIENNEEIYKLSNKKIYCIPPWPIILEYIHNIYKTSRIYPLTEKDDEIFKISYYYQNLQYNI